MTLELGIFKNPSESSLLEQKILKNLYHLVEWIHFQLQHKPQIWEIINNKRVMNHLFQLFSLGIYKFNRKNKGKICRSLERRNGPSSITTLGLGTRPAHFNNSCPVQPDKWSHWISWKCSLKEAKGVASVDSIPRLTDSFDSGHISRTALTRQPCASRENGAQSTTVQWPHRISDPKVSTSSATVGH